MNSYERGIRAGKEGELVSEEEFREYLAKQWLPWTDAEKQKVTDMFKIVEKKVVQYGLTLPDPIKLIKTTGLDDIRECGGYCRGNTIVLLQKSVDNLYEGIIVHEMFHIMSQNNPSLRYKLYRQLGFYHCNEIELPKDIHAQKVTNPDAPRLDVCIELTVKETNKKVKCLPVIFYNKDPDFVGGFFDRLGIKLLVVEKDEDGVYVVKLDDNEKPTLYTVGDVEDFFSQVGDTHYYFHPEEVLATRFDEMVCQKMDNKFIRMLNDTLLH